MGRIAFLLVGREHARILQCLIEVPAFARGLG